MAKVHEGDPRQPDRPLCGNERGRTRARHHPERTVTCKSCLRLIKTKRILARRVQVRQAARLVRGRFPMLP